MVNEKDVILTYEGLKNLENELEQLKTVRRKEVTEKIKQALAFGDLSENSEYDAAKNEQAQVEVRIVQVESMLKNAKLIDEDELDTSAVSVGSTVKLFDCEYQEEITYTIVGSTEADPQKHRISNESPVGNALLGHSIGDAVNVTVPSGAVLEFRILDISVK